MNDVLLVDPQLGSLGLGVLESLVPGARTWPRATVHTMLGLAQANQILTQLQNADALPATMVGRAAGCNVVARLLADGAVDRVLLINPITTLTGDSGLNAERRADRGFSPPTSIPVNPDHRAVWTDPLIEQGRLPERAYELMALGMSSHPEVRRRLATMLRTVEGPRQPYDDRQWAPSPQLAEHLDWFANLTDVAPGTATVWLSGDPEGHPPTRQAAYLREKLPTVEVIIPEWAELEFLIEPGPVATAISDWLRG